MGRVRRVAPAPGTACGLLKIQRRGKKSYARVGLSLDGVNKTHLVHQFVAVAFLGPRPVGMEVNHKDGDRGNAALSNLEYTTRSGNRKHSRDVLKTLGKLNEAQRAEIMRSDRRRGEAVRLGRKFGVWHGTIIHLWKGRTWA